MDGTAGKGKGKGSESDPPLHGPLQWQINGALIPADVT